MKVWCRKSPAGWGGLTGCGGLPWAFRSARLLRCSDKQRVCSPLPCSDLSCPPHSPAELGLKKPADLLFPAVGPQA